MSSGGGGTTHSTSTQMNYSPEESAENARLKQEARRIYDLTAPQTYAAGYPGAKPVYYGPTTEAALGNLTNVATGFMPQFLNQANQSLGFSLQDVLYPESNPALQGYMAAALRPIQEDYLGPTGAMSQLEQKLLGPNGVMSQLKRSYTDPGGFMSQIRTQAGQEGQVGSSRQGIAEGMAGRNYYRALQDATTQTTRSMEDTARKYINAIGDTSARVASEGYGQGLTAMGRAQAMAPQYAQMATLPASLLGQVGQMYDTQGQRYEDYLAAQRQWGLNAPWMPLQNYANIVYGGASPGTTTTGTSDAGGTSTAGRLAGAGAMGLGTWAALSAIPATAPFAIPAGALMGALGLFSDR